MSSVQFVIKAEDIEKIENEIGKIGLRSEAWINKYLKEHAGHLKVETTLKYYIKAGETSKEQGMRILDSMTTEDPLITIEGPGIGGQETRVFTVRKSQWDRIQSEQKRKK